MITKFGPCLSLIFVMVLMKTCSADPILIKILRVRYSLNGDFRISHRPSWYMVQEALLEFKELTADHRKEAMQEPENRLLRDSVLWPFQKYAEELTDENEREFFLSMLFQTYKWFRSYYVDGKEIYGEFYQTPRCRFLYDAAVGRHKKLQLQSRDFDAAMAELSVFRTKAKKMAESGELPVLRLDVSALYNTIARNSAVARTLDELEGMEAWPHSLDEKMKFLKRHIYMSLEEAERSDQP